MSRQLCRIEDIADGEGIGFSLDQEEADRLSSGQPEIFIVRRGYRVFGYANVCPHLSSPLDWVENQFMSPDKTHIMCATHGAQFRVEDGHCVTGPCEGEALTQLRVSILKGIVVLEARPAAPVSASA
jgi:nitrite reductase/ring-hydroxylating ferredoxin subunit